MNEPSRTAAATARDVAGWVPLLARLGYAAKGVVYLLIGWIAAKAALAAGEAQGATGALSSLRDETGGMVALVAIAIGLFCHVLWRAVQAVLDPEHHGDRASAKRAGMRAFYALSGLIYGALAIAAWQLSQGGDGGSQGGHAVWVSALLEKPFGTWLVMAAGIGVIGYGLHQIAKALKGDVNRHMQATHADVHRGLVLLGRIGTGARGLVMLPIGWFVFNAGRLYRAEKAVDTEDVLRMLGHGWLLAAVGIGLAAYGAHQVGKALYRRIGRPL